MDFKSTFGVWGEQGLIGLVNSGASSAISAQEKFQIFWEVFVYLSWQRRE